MRQVDGLSEGSTAVDDLDELVEKSLPGEAKGFSLHKKLALPFIFYVFLRAVYYWQQGL